MGKRENEVETYLNDQIIARGGFTRKITYEGRRGAADRFCFLPNGKLYIIEVKTSNGTESTLQRRERERLIGMGYTALCLYGKEQINELMEVYDYARQTE